MQALGHAILPTELGAPGREAVIADFQRWIAGYREGVELTHGYGTSRIRFSGPTPATRWTGQLEALDAEARRRTGKPFSAIAASSREDIVRAALAGERLDRIPPIADARHVAVALLAFFYDSPAATDLCYEAKIGKQSCRPLAHASAQPVALRTRR